ncbi:MAG: succinate dehydrogenase, hydrophobic membrane anchor protein [Hyphomicrobiales bacterium]|nr:succinate dehydrogenase, hydrophobic membrane anchor protein [Hyphomicrobiales bacterium]MCP5372119.1 succinate dehydrogenase, hydrophobic membrane anchor protein [Hyphomicrobiales bacterium]
MDMRSHLGRARGLGSAKEGYDHWWGQRLTSIAMVPLSFWFVYSMVGLIGADYETLLAWAGTHGNALMMVLFVMTLFHHLNAGVQVIIEDYVHTEWLKIASLIVVKYGCIALALSCIIAVLRLAFGG